MFGRDPILPLNPPLKPTVRYLDADENILSLEALKNVYQLVANNLELAQRKGDTKAPAAKIKLKEGDSILAGLWEPKYAGDYKFVSFPIKTHVEVED